MVVLIPQKIVLVLVDEKKYPQKIEFNPQNIKKGGQNGGTSISPNIEGVTSLGVNISPLCVCVRYPHISSLFPVDLSLLPGCLQVTQCAGFLLVHWRSRCSNDTSDFQRRSLQWGKNNGEYQYNIKKNIRKTSFLRNKSTCSGFTFYTSITFQSHW